MFRRLGSILLAVAAVALLALLTVFDMERLSEGIRRALGLEAGRPEGGRQADMTEEDRRVRQVIDGIPEEGIRATMARLSSFPTRMAGTPGCAEAGRWIEAQFREIGLERVTAESFPVTVPVDRGAALTVEGSGETIPLFGMWPNQVRTPSLPEGGVSGALIDGGQGEFPDFNGKAVAGGVALMGFGGGQNALNARMLGAEAVLFYDDGRVTLGEASEKFLNVPAHIPRFWVEREGAERLKALAQQGVRVRVTSRMDWQTLPTANVYGFLPGLDEVMPLGGRVQSRRKWKDQVIVLEAYYDAISVTPGLAPGAENAAGIAALVEVARALKAHGTKYSVLFLATSGHFQGLAGIHDFLCRHARKSDHFRGRMPEADRVEFKLMIGLDLSTRGDRVGGFGMGTFMNPAKATNEYLKNLLAPYANAFEGYASGLFAGEDRYVDAVAPAQRTWKTFMPVPLGLDHEAAAFVGFEGMSLVTLGDGRERVDTPLDRMADVDVGRLTKQVRTVAGLVLKMAGDAQFFREAHLSLRDEGHSLSGRILYFDRAADFAIPRVPVPGALVTYQQPGPNSVAGVRTLVVTQADSAGRFRFDIVRNKWANEILAYRIGEDGEVVSAPDMGQDGDVTYPIRQPYGWWENEMMEVLFRCRSISLFEIVDASYLSALDHMTVLGTNDASPRSFGYRYVANQSAQEGRTTQAAVVFAPPGERVKILMSTGLFGIKYMLINAPQDLFDHPVRAEDTSPAVLARAQGTGYPADGGIIALPSYRAARDMWVVDDARMKQLARYAVQNRRLSALHEEARVALLEAQGHLDRLDYERFIAAARRGWGLEARAYPDVKETANDTVQGIVFYFVLVLPFAFFCERLLFGFPDVRRRIAGFAGLFLLIFLILRVVHPAFKLSSSPYIIFLAFVILFMGGVAIWIVISKFSEEMRKLKRAETGVYETDVGRSSATAAAVSLGLSNLKKRPLRTGLTAATLTLLTFTVLSFTSVQTMLRFYKLPRSNRPPYAGGLVRDRNWRGLQLSTLDYVASHFRGRARVAPRAFYIAQTHGERAYVDFSVPATGKSSFVNGLLGMTPEEPGVMGIDRALLSGRWFRPGERNACILPSDLAALVGLRPEDAGRASIRMLGGDFAVVGVIDAAPLDRMKDMDDERLTPIDMTMETTGTSDWRGLSQDPRAAAMMPIEAFTHLDGVNTLILPYDFVMEIGGTLRSVAVTDFRDEAGRPVSDYRAEIEAFMARVALTMFVGEGERVTVYSSIGATSISGLGNLFIPVVIAALIVLNTMMGAVYERFREIGIYSSVGLAPNHIAALFLAEAAVFATLGAVLGYLIGQVLILFLNAYGLLGGLSVNYSSLSAVSSTLIVMATVMLSTLYPARKAADMAVPDVTRKWAFPEPEGDDWRFDFPFTLGATEALGVYTYLARAFEAYGESSIGRFVTGDVRFTAEDVRGEPEYRIEMTVWLAPYDLGISQAVRLLAIPTGERGIYKIEVDIHRLSGDVASWQRVNRGFLNDIRKMFLVWKTSPPEAKGAFTRQGREMLGAGVAGD
ncbi:MAG: FtsX-like permease family protein [Candidatus Latescibacteria bacterium]|nr:FtsX-like permease family protein [Candidatus Latescibacterota bacterium]